MRVRMAGCQRMKTTYLVTGRTVFGRRFHIASENKAYLMGINIYRGSF